MLCNQKFTVPGSQSTNRNFYFTDTDVIYFIILVLKVPVLFIFPSLLVQFLKNTVISCTIYVLGDVLTDKYLHDNVPPDMVGNVNFIGKDLINQLEQLTVCHFLQQLVNVQLLNVVLRIHSFVKS